MDKIDKIIKDNDYEGIRDQDGFETLEETIREQYPKMVKQIIARLE